MSDALATIASIRVFVAEAHEPGSPAALVAKRLAQYVDARGALTLEAAFGLRPGRGQPAWWRLERQRRGREALTSLRALVPAGGYRSEAEAIRAAIARYRGGRWGVDSKQAVPAGDETRAALHALLTMTGGAVPCRRSVERALGDCDTESRFRVAEPVVESDER